MIKSGIFSISPDNLEVVLDLSISYKKIYFVSVDKKYVKLGFTK